MVDVGLALFVYRRPRHTERVIESIKKNKFPYVYVFQDGLREQKDSDAWQEVGSIIAELERGHDSHVEIHVATMNRGLADSIVSGIEYVLKRHECVIALEDDVVLSPDYRTYAEACFLKYRDTPKVMSICGAGVNDLVVDDAAYLRQYPYDVYFTYGGTSVAYGTWRDRWKLYRRGRDYAIEILNDPSQCNTIRERGGSWLLDLLQTVVESPQKVDTWATYMGVMEFLNEGLAVIPIRALATDIGRDGSGTNTRGKTSRFETELHELSQELRLPPRDSVCLNQYLAKRQDIAIHTRASLVRAKLFLEKIKRRIGICY